LFSGAGVLDQIPEVFRAVTGDPFSIHEHGRRPNVVRAPSDCWQIQNLASSESSARPRVDLSAASPLSKSQISGFPPVKAAYPATVRRQTGRFGDRAPASLTGIGPNHTFSLPPIRVSPGFPLLPGREYSETIFLLPH
jgi:hypothetical protein